MSIGENNFDLGKNEEFETCCEGDIDGDQLIGVNDILYIIATWGSNDPDGDVGDDGMVNTNDILFVLSNWGECPS